MSETKGAAVNYRSFVSRVGGFKRLESMSRGGPTAIQLYTRRKELVVVVGGGGQGGGGGGSRLMDRWEVES